jgi:beta-lactam-binding protein with PASTA domain
MAKKSLFDYAFFLLLYLVLFFLAANLSSQIVLRGELIGLPNVAGKTLEQARTELADKRTSLAIQGYRYDNRLERGKIIAQDPPAGSRVRANRTVKVLVSEGSESVTVPKLEGRSLEWASQALKSAGLRRGRISQIHTSQYAAGRIIAQDPPAGGASGKDNTVDFLVSQGAWEARYVMPDLIARNAAIVKSQLEALGFEIAEIHYSYYPGLGSGVVIKQFPSPGFRIQKRNKITLEVSK